VSRACLASLSPHPLPFITPLCSRAHDSRPFLFASRYSPLLRVPRPSPPVVPPSPRPKWLPGGDGSPISPFASIPSARREVLWASKRERGASRLAGSPGSCGGGGTGVQGQGAGGDFPFLFPHRHRSSHRSPLPRTLQRVKQGAGSGAEDITGGVFFPSALEINLTVPFLWTGAAWGGHASPKGAGIPLLW